MRIALAAAVLVPLLHASLVAGCASTRRLLRKALSQNANECADMHINSFCLFHIVGSLVVTD
jgi:hypothetical protein